MLCRRPEGQGRVEGGSAALSSPAMPDHVQIRIISLLEEAANSFEQLETLANRTLSEIPAAAIEQVDLRAIERDYVNDENEPGSEMDHIVFIKYKTDKVQA
jgi:hypothetical protein